MTVIDPTKQKYYIEKGAYFGADNQVHEVLCLMNANTHRQVGDVKLPEEGLET